MVVEAGEPETPVLRRGDPLAPAARPSRQCRWLSEKMRYAPRRSALVIFGGRHCRAGDGPSGSENPRSACPKRNPSASCHLPGSPRVRLPHLRLSSTPAGRWRSGFLQNGNFSGGCVPTAAHRRDRAGQQEIPILEIFSDVTPSFSGNFPRQRPGRKRPIWPPRWARPNRAPEQRTMT